MRIAIHLIGIALALLMGQAATAQTLDEANLFYERKDYEAAFWSYEALALQGLSKAQERLAFMYSFGEGVTKDESQAVYWYRMSALQGSAHARKQLLGMLRGGYGTAIDRKQIYAWLQKEAGDGNVRARIEMDKMIRDGFDPSTASLVPRNADGEGASREARRRRDGEVVPSRAKPDDRHAIEVKIKRSADGHFRVRGAVNGVAVNFLVDTGATHVSISEEIATAAKLGQGRAVIMRTASGESKARVLTGTLVMAGHLKSPSTTVLVGLTDKDASFALLGQSFLSKMDILVKGDEMVLRKRD